MLSGVLLEAKRGSVLWFHLLSGVSRLGQGPQADSALPLAFGLIACSVRFRGVGLGWGGLFFSF